MRNESVNDEGVKMKNHKFWSVKSSSGDEFFLAPKVMQALPSMLNNVLETLSRIFNVANSLQTKLCPFMQQHEIIL